VISVAVAATLGVLIAFQQHPSWPGRIQAAGESAGSASGHFAARSGAALAQWTTDFGKGAWRRGEEEADRAHTLYIGVVRGPAPPPAIRLVARSDGKPLHTFPDRAPVGQTLARLALPPANPAGKSPAATVPPPAADDARFHAAMDERLAPPAVIKPERVTPLPLAEARGRLALLAPPPPIARLPETPAVLILPPPAAPPASPRPPAAENIPGLLASTPMPQGAVLDSAPPGFISFCSRFLDQCVSSPKDAAVLHFDLALQAKLRAVNRAVNDTVYPESDKRHYGRAEYWDLPNDGYGNSKHYALLKRKALIDAGYSERALRIAIADTPHEKRHVVLTVATDRGDFVLDNLASDIVPWTEAGYHWLERQDDRGGLGWVALSTDANAHALLIHGGASASAYLPAGQPVAAAPPGYISFCSRFPDQCYATGLGGPRLHFDATVFRLLVAIDDAVNRAITPEPDEQHYGRAEYWDLPRDGRGNCKHYALLKRAKLIEAGLSDKALRLAIVDTPRENRHVVLTVATDKGDLVLDNLNDAVKAWTETGYRWLARQDGKGGLGWVAFDSDTLSVPTSETERATQARRAAVRGSKQ